jgi:hypothetical protein
LDTEQTAAILGFQAHAIPLLVAAKLLRPLGKPSRQSVKYFAACEVEKLSHDFLWLSKATTAVYSYWGNQNQKRPKKRSVPKTEELVAA